MASSDTESLQSNSIEYLKEDNEKKDVKSEYIVSIITNMHYNDYYYLLGIFRTM